MAASIEQQIAQKKEARSVAWRTALAAIVPGNPNDLPAEEARLAVFKAEQAPEVVALTTEIAELRFQQVSGETGG